MYSASSLALIQVTSGRIIRSWQSRDRVRRSPSYQLTGGWAPRRSLQTYAKYGREVGFEKKAPPCSRSTQDRGGPSPRASHARSLSPPSFASVIGEPPATPLRIRSPRFGKPDPFTQISSKSTCAQPTTVISCCYTTRPSIAPPINPVTWPSCHSSRSNDWTRAIGNAYRRWRKRWTSPGEPSG